MSNKKRENLIFEKVESVYAIRIDDSVRTPQLADLFQLILDYRTGNLEEIRRLKSQVEMLQKRDEKKEQALRTDPLTELPNGVSLHEKLSAVLNDRRDRYKAQEKAHKKAQEKAQEEAKKNGLPPPSPEPFKLKPLEDFTVVHCDINHFKLYNEKFGQETTNGLIRAIARLLQHSVRRGNNARLQDALARSNEAGDEFVMLLPKITEETAKERMKTIMNGIHTDEMDVKGIAEQKFLVSTPEHPTPKHFLVEHVTIATGCYQLDQQLPQTQTYDKDYVQVIHKAYKKMDMEKKRMRTEHETDFIIKEITDPTELQSLQEDDSIIKIFPIARIKTISRNRK